MIRRPGQLDTTPVLWALAASIVLCWIAAAVLLYIEAAT